MSNKFLDIISSPLMNLDHTYRYSGTKLIESESLSHHIVDTIMMGLKIIDDINSKVGHLLSPETYVMKAVYHDLEEVITGDVPRPLKYHDEATLEAMRGVADEVAEELFRREFHDNTHFEIWNNAKHDKEGYILKLVDTLVVAGKVVKEVSLLHNYYMIRVAYEVSHYLEELIGRISLDRVINDEKAISYLQNLVSDAHRAMLDIIEENISTMEKFNITNLSMI